MAHDLRVAVAYLWLLVPISALSIVVSFATLLLANALPGHGGPLWVGVALNVVPSSAAGYLCYRSAARFWRRRTLGVSRHWIRTAPLYLLSATLWTAIIGSWSEPGFGLLAQLVVWPALSIVAGIVGDLIGWRSGRSAVAAV